MRPLLGRFPLRHPVLVAGFLLVVLCSVVVLRTFGSHPTATLGVNDRCTDLSGDPPGGVQLYHPYQMPHDVTLYNTCTTEENCPSCTVSQCARCYVEEYVCGGISAGSYFKNTTACNLCENGVCTEAATSSFASDGSGPELQPTIEIAESSGSVYCNATYGKKCYDVVWTIANVGRTEEYVSGFSIGLSSGGIQFFGTYTGCTNYGGSIECSFPAGQGKHFPAGYSETWVFPVTADDPPAACPNSMTTHFAASALYTGFNGVSFLQIPCTESASSASSSGVLHGCIDPDGGDFYTKTRVDMYVNGTPDALKTRIDSCDGAQVIEYICDSQSFLFGPTAQRYNCPRGCNDGACIPAPNVCENGVLPVRSHPRGMVAVGSKVYVLNFTSRSVSVINTATNTVAATLPFNSRIDAIAAVGSKVYVTNALNATVSVINAATDAVTAAIPVGANPVGLTVIGTRLYVLHQSDFTISIINTNTNTVTATILTGDYNYSIAAVGSKLYVSHENPSISIIDANTNTVTATIPVSARPGSLIAVGSKLFVAHWDTGTVSVIDTTTNTVQATLSVGVNPELLAVNGTRLYVGNRSNATVSVIDTNANAVVATIPVSSNVKSLALLGSKLYVAAGGGSVSVIDTNTNTVTTTIPGILGAETIIVAGTKAYLTNGQVEGKVSIIDTENDVLSCAAAAAVSSSSSLSSALPAGSSSSSSRSSSSGTSFHSSSSSVAPAGSSSSAAQTSRSSSSALAVSSAGALCGNRVIETGEQCDDGNIVPGDGCGQTCQREAGWVCSGVPSVCTTVCGDGIRAGVEQCDDTNLNNGDGCSRTCQTEQGISSAVSSQPIAVISSSAASGAPTCGNGQREGSEQCEADSECFGGTVCRNCRCVVPTQRCGNGTVEVPEQCDSGHPCPDGGFCTATCSCTVRAASSARSSAPSLSCGNGTLNDGEQCDINAPCPIPGSVCVNCSCRPPAASCGNGIIEGQEECEFGHSCGNQEICQECRCAVSTQATVPPTSSSAGGGVIALSAIPPQTCGNALLEGSEQCETNAACPRPGDLCISCECHNPPEARCGNGQLEVSEECDDANVQDGDGCSAQCQREIPTIVASQILCGNGLVEQGEECDDGNAIPDDGCSALCQRTALSLQPALALVPEPAAPPPPVSSVPAAPALPVPEPAGPTPKRVVSSAPAFFPAASVPVFSAAPVSAPAPSVLATTVIQPPSWQPYASVVPYAPPTGPVGATGPASVAMMAAGAAAGWAWMRRKRNL